MYAIPHRMPCSFLSTGKKRKQAYANKKPVTAARLMHKTSLSFFIFTNWLWFIMHVVVHAWSCLMQWHYCVKSFHSLKTCQHCHVSTQYNKRHMKLTIPLLINCHSLPSLHSLSLSRTPSLWCRRVPLPWPPDLCLSWLALWRRARLSRWVRWNARQM